MVFLLSSCSGDSLQISAKRSTGYSIARGGNFMDEGVAYFISLSELEEATNNFSKKIGKGSFGSVYYGRMKDGKEVAVKIMADTSSHRTQQFVTEVLTYYLHNSKLVEHWNGLQEHLCMQTQNTHFTYILLTYLQVALLSRIHHRNLVPLIGYCEEEHQRILVYEYMHNGTLRDRIYGLSSFF